MTPTLPTVQLSARGAALVRGGHPWLDPVDVERRPGGPGDVVRMTDPRGALIGTALYSPCGRIALRVLSREELPLDGPLLRERIAAAAARRRGIFNGGGGGEEAKDAYRVVHGEADLLPGLFIDRYGEAAVIQTAAAAMDAREAEIAQAVVEVLGVSLVVQRDDGSARDLDGLPRRKGVLHGPEGEAGAGTLVRFHDAGALMEADLLTDGKTGSFLDQQENHACALRYARDLFSGGGTALDAFTYHGGFALALGRAGLRVLACDESPQAIARARHNAGLNQLQVDFQVRNAFDLLRELEAAGRRFQVVVLDPPALAKRGQRGQDGAPGRRAAMTGALRAYKELNLRGLRLLSPGGLLITCSCSGRLSPAAFGEVLESAARDVGRPVTLLERRGAGRDHPVLLGVPETEYLKCWVLQAL